MKHRKYGGSTAARTIACPAWAGMSENIPRSESVFAAVGTALHAVMEELMTGELAKPEDAIGVTYEGVEITADMCREKLVPALKAFSDLCDAYGVTEYEPEVECSYTDDVGGYADIVLRGEPSDGKVYAIVCDWKFGDGVIVDPDDSPQAKFYGMAARHDSSASDLFEGAEFFVAAIIQPTDRDEITLKTWEAPISVIADFEKQVNRAVREAESKHPPMAAGDHCKFCPAAPICPAKTGDALRALRMDPEELETLHESLDMVGELKSWITAVEKVAFEQLNAGVEVKGWKLVAKRAVARWSDEEAVIKAVRRRLGGIGAVTVRKILSPAQMRKLAKAKGKDIDFDEYIVKTSSGNTMAPEDDKRPAVLAGEAIQAALKSLTQ